MARLNEEFYEVVSTLRKQGKNYQEIGDELGKSRRYVQDYCGRHKELQYTDEEREKSKSERVSPTKGRIFVNWDKKVQEVLGGRFELVSRIEREDGLEPQLIIKCKTCGSEKKISSVSLRSKVGQVVHCSECQKKETRERQEAIREHEQWQTKLHREVKKNHKAVQIGMNFCGCGKVIRNGTKYCEECGRRRIRSYERTQETKRRTRLKAKGFDKSITLEKLYERDKGVCYICHKTCDWGDFQKINGAFVVGGSYPTVEHLIPLCKDGTHTWDNVKLACHSCNSKKGRRSYEDIAPISDSE